MLRGCPGVRQDQACALEGEHHLVHRGRADAEVALHVGLGRPGVAVDAGIGVDESQAPALVVGEAVLGRGHCSHNRFIWASHDAEAAMPCATNWSAARTSTGCAGYA